MKQFYLKVLLYSLFFAALGFPSSDGFSQTSDWLPLDNGLACDTIGSGASYIKDLFVDSSSGDFYAAGHWVYDGDCDELRTISKWDGQEWLTLGTGPYAMSDSPIRYQGDLLASGGFLLNSEGEADNYVCRWNGELWDTIPESVNAYVHEFEIIDSLLYAVGQFEECGGQQSGICCVYDGDEWWPLKAVPSFNRRTLCIEQYDGEIYIGGTHLFDNESGEQIRALCYWDGENYQTVGQGFDYYQFNAVNDFAVYKGKLYMSGEFLLAGDDELTNLAYFDGDSLQAVEPSPNSHTSSLHVHNNALYVGGGFTAIDDVEAEHLARYDGEEWLAINTDSMFSGYGNYFGLDIGRVVRDMDVYEDTLYIVGDFYTIGQDTLRHVAKLNKNLTTDFPPPATNTEEYDLVTFDFDLYPNPSPGSLTFSWQQPAAGEVSYRITDTRGRLVEHSPPVIYQSGKHEETLTLGHLTPGTYFIRLITTSGVATKRWVRLE